MTQPHIFDALIVGGGPAGVSCALWLKQLGFEPCLIERNAKCGGLQLLNARENPWIASSVGPYGADVAAAMHENMTRYHVHMRLNTQAGAAVVGPDQVEIILSSGESVAGKYVVLAGGVLPKTGGHLHRLGTIVGPGHAVAKTDFLGARVAILGGGDSAFENYGFVANKGASSIRLFARTVRVRPGLVAQIPEKDVFVGKYAVDHAHNTVNGEKFDQIVVLYGYEVDKAAVLGLDLMMKPDGFVWTNEECLTSNERVYAIGELAQRAHPCCVTSMADGVVAAKALQRRLEITHSAKLAGMAKRVFGLGVNALS